ncbi:MAG: LysE family translocator [Bacteroidales bacterium]|nr:LysE family translocator [Bacteroidales bacterium]MCF8344146.1 LysE family translocator [Bacteroidales bacterium]MCF8349983.1 LysE family translocator [Bacteroidales bacterium]MCF8376725.1 LysE family translocator [Bacteroidales bacterium]
MFSSFYEGIVLGLTLSIVFGFGPALFALIQTSMHRGFFSGVLLAIGIFLSDVALVALCFFGAYKLVSSDQNKMIFGLVSGIILIIFGIVTFTRNVKITGNNQQQNNDAPGPVTFLLKGFFLNIANPFVWIFWMGVVVTVTANYEGHVERLVVFFSGTLLTVITTDILKTFLAYKIKKYLTVRFIEWVNRIAGIGLMGFGVYLIIRSFLEF